MARPVTLLSGTYGLYNTLPAKARTPARKGGIVAFTDSFNMVCDDTGRPRTMDGYSQVHNGACHSFRSFGDYALLVRNGVLSWMNSGGDINQIVALQDSVSWMSYARVDTGMGRHLIYFTNGTDSGITRFGEYAAWPATDPIGDVSERHFVGFPGGRILLCWKGRMLVADGSVVYVSEPYSFGAYDLARCRMQFGTDVVAMQGVNTGLWIADTRHIYFISGGVNFFSDPDPLWVKANITGIPGAFSDLIEISRFPVDYSGLSCLIAANDAVYLCGEEGFIMDVTGGRVEYLHDSASVDVSKGFIHSDAGQSFILME